MSATSRKMNQLFRDNSPERISSHEEDANIYKTQLDQMNKEMEQPAMSCSSDESETEILKYEEVKGKRKNQDIGSA